MGKKLYVGNLTYGVTDSALEQMFAAHGTVQSAQVIMDRDTGRSKGFGFVEMGSDQEAQAAIAALNGQQVEGRSLVPLMVDPKVEWPERILFTHVGRWPKGAKPADYKYAHCSVRSPRWHLVCDSRDGSKKWQLFDVKADPGEKTDVADKHPAVVKELDTAYDMWWASVQPQLVNEA